MVGCVGGVWWWLWWSVVADGDGRWWQVLAAVSGGSAGGGWLGCGSSKGVSVISVVNLYFSLVSLIFWCIPLKLGVPENPFP